MGTLRLAVSENLNETIEYTCAGLPVRSAVTRLEEYAGMAADCHWHEDLEFTVILEGAMAYFVNGRVYHLTRGAGVFVNANRLHYGYAERGEDGTPERCQFYCLVFSPALLAANALVAHTFVDRLIYDTNTDALLFLPDSEALAILRRIQTLAAEKNELYELRLQSAFFDLLCALLKTLPAARTDGERERGNTGASTRSLKAMIAFIHNHYAEPVTLRAIASAGAVCRSVCCALFRENLHQSVMEYVQRYRVRAACALLRDESRSISAVAEACGFGSPSFFSKTFRALTGSTPRAWRRGLQAGTNRTAVP